LLQKARDSPAAEPFSNFHVQISERLLYRLSLVFEDLIVIASWTNQSLRLLPLIEPDATSGTAPDLVLPKTLT